MFINETMFTIDAPRPAAGQISFEWFGFADALKTVAFRVFYQIVEAFKQLRLSFLKPEIIFPRRIRECEFHFSINSRSLTEPASASDRDFRKCSALAGFDKR